MSKKIQKQRALAVQRYQAGESPQSICASLGKTKPWLYKWVSRYTPDDHAWCEGQSRRPLTSPYRTPAEIEAWIWSAYACITMGSSAAIKPSNGR